MTTLSKLWNVVKPKHWLYSQNCELATNIFLMKKDTESRIFRSSIIITWLGQDHLTLHPGVSSGYHSQLGANLQWMTSIPSREWYSYSLVKKPGEAWAWWAILSSGDSPADFPLTQSHMNILTGNYKEMVTSWTDSTVKMSFDRNSCDRKYSRHSHRLDKAFIHYW
jgi:hypothetical protein